MDLCTHACLYSQAFDANLEIMLQKTTVAMMWIKALVQRPRHDLDTYFKRDRLNFMIVATSGFCVSASPETSPMLDDGSDGAVIEVRSSGRQDG